jgi:zinc protease
MARAAAVILLVVMAARLGGAAPVHAAASVLAADLDNGLRVLLLEDHRSPIVSFQVWYRVGARNEQRGVTGIAHFLEHMMFKGTMAHPRGTYARLVEQNGGRDNAGTTMDWTSYYVDIAADRVDLVISLEADRMRNLVIDPPDVDSEREVVLEERRTRTEDDPGAFLGEEVNAMAYKAHPYGQPVVGWLEDVRRITPDDLRAFYRTYYVPNNAMIVAVGDFQAPGMLEKIKAQFGPIPRAATPPAVRAVEPPQNGERRVTVKKQAQLPIVYLAWHVPDHSSPDALPLEVLSTILSGGRASRLFKDLVYERQIALDAGGDYSYLSIDPPMFWFYATAMPGQTPEAVEQALLAEMERLGREPVTDEELQRAKNQTEAAFVFADDSVHQRAATLARFELIGGFTLADGFLRGVRAVTAADIQRVARAWFPPDKKTTGVLLPLR